MPKTSDAKLKANDKYIKSKDTIVVRVNKGEKEIIKAYAENNHTSINALVYDYLKSIIPELNHQ